MGFTLIFLCSLSMWNHNNCIGADLTQWKFSMSFSRVETINVLITRDFILYKTKYDELFPLYWGPSVYETFSSDIFLPQIAILWYGTQILIYCKGFTKDDPFCTRKVVCSLFVVHAKFVSPTGSCNCCSWLEERHPFPRSRLHDALNTRKLPYIVDWYNNVKDITGREWGQCHATRGDMVPCKKDVETERQCD